MSAAWASLRGRPSPGRRGLGVLLALATTVAAVACSSTETPPAGARTVDDRTVNDRLFECLSAEGFPVTRGADGGVNFVDPEDNQFSEYQSALADCRRQLVADGLLPADDENALRTEYERIVALSDCLAANGLPTAELPSEAVYLEKHEELNLFALNTEQEWQQALEKCPEQMLPFESGAPR
ncbi:hypothetical protein ACK8GG_17175 [Micromonosporaceae bacterium DT55]|uniref:hypothetical protein n=1 Tax=Melissospora conviva TaxID=3388432 RepID=UPI003C1B33F4